MSKYFVPSFYKQRLRSMTDAELRSERERGELLWKTYSPVHQRTAAMVMRATANEMQRRATNHVA